jgi:glutamate decarboxylase
MPIPSDMTTPSVLDSTYATRYMAEPIPAHKMPDNEIPAHVVKQVVRDLRTLDARPNLNLASFVTTFMEPEAEALMLESLNVNFVDSDEYPSSTLIANRCVSMLAHLYHSPAVDENGDGDAVGAPCVGSSEAIMLSGLALKKRWQTARAAAGLPADKPNLVMGSETHVCWEKFCRYWDVEARYILAEEGRYVATPELLAAHCDENTIGVVAVLGSTFNGEFEDVEGIDAAVSELNKKNGWKLSVHVDGASGAFVAPFIYPDFKFDFRLPNVASINVSGHKYGLTYCGIGWAIWRDAEHLPESMVFYANYLGTVERSITLNFSRGASQIIGQYYQLLRLGREGYTKIMTNLNRISVYVREAIIATGDFEILSKDEGVPLVAFRLKPRIGADGKPHKRAYDEFELADRMRTAGWVIPAYTGPPGADAVKMMRITIREDLSMTMAGMVIEELKNSIKWMDAHFKLNQDEVLGLAGKLLGRHLSRLDSKVVADIEALTILKPC